MSTWPPKTNYAAGDILTAAQMTDIGNQMTPLGYTAGKNKIINGDFRVNQRNFSSTTTSATYGFDRWRFTASGGTVTYSAQTFTPGTAPVTGYEGINYARLVTASQSASSDRALLNQLIEDVRTLAGVTATISFWAKAASGTPKINVALNQNFGTGGSSSVNAPIPAAQTISTSWARYSFTIAIPSVSGKTISATDSRLNVQIYVSDGGDQSTGVGAQNNTFDIWGVQVEAGSVGTAFQTATGTIQGELAACQRYYEKSYNQATAPGTNTDAAAFQKVDIASSTTGTAGASVEFKVAKRGTPTITLYSSVSANSGKWVLNKSGTQTEYNYTVYSPQENGFVGYCAGAASGLTAYNPYGLLGHWTASAEL